MYLVRHAAVVVDRAAPSHLWQLSAEGRSAAAQLELPAGRALTSGEDKARETALLAGLDAAPDDRLREVVCPWSDDCESDVRRYLTGADLGGWEPASRPSGGFVRRLTAATASPSRTDSRSRSSQA